MEYSNMGFQTKAAVNIYVLIYDIKTLKQLLLCRCLRLDGCFSVFPNDFRVCLSHSNFPSCLIQSAVFL